MKTKKAPPDPKTILERLETEDDRDRVSIYVSQRIYADFKASCGKAPVSRVLEELMKWFSDNAKQK